MVLWILATGSSFFIIIIIDTIYHNLFLRLLFPIKRSSYIFPVSFPPIKNIYNAREGRERSWAVAFHDPCF